MTADAYHTWIGAIFIAMMIGFFIAGGKDILVSLLISGFVSVGVARMIRDGYEYVLGIRFPWGVIRTVLSVMVLVVVVCLLGRGFVWIWKRIEDRRDYFSGQFTQSTQPVYIAPPPPPPPPQPNLPNIVDKSLLKIISYSDGSPKRIFHGTSLEAAKDIIHNKRIKISNHGNGMWGSANFEIALSYSSRNGGETGVIIEFKVARDVVLKDQGSEIYVVPVPEGTPGNYFWFGKQFRPVATYDQNGRRITLRKE